MKSPDKPVIVLQCMNLMKKMLVSLTQKLFNFSDEPCFAKNRSNPVVEEPEITRDEAEFEEEQIVSDNSEEKDIERLEKLLKEALMGEKKKTVVSPAFYILSSSEDQWFYNPNARSMTRLPGGSQLIVQDPEPDDDGKVLCYSDFGFVLVPAEEIVPLGMN